MKKCNKCLNVKDETEFYKRSYTDSLMAMCKACVADCNRPRAKTYVTSKAARDAVAKYIKSEKGQAARKRYWESEKGKATYQAQLVRQRARYRERVDAAKKAAGGEA